MLTIEQRIADELAVKVEQVIATVTLLDEGSTVPFIARYRKEVTGSLDDTQLRNLEERLRYLREMEERRSSILKSIEDQDKLSPTLKQQILEADTKTRLEDLYLPYKQKRKTKGQTAIEAGLLPLADALFENPSLVPQTEAEKYLNPDKKVSNAKEALDGAKYILMERFSENADLLAKLREKFTADAIISCKVVEGKEKEGAKFKDYFDHNEAIGAIPSHRALAILRGRNSGILQVKVDVDTEETAAGHPCEGIIAQHVGISSNDQAADKWLDEVVRWTWKIKLHNQLEGELISNARESSEEEAISVFALNLKHLLMGAPAGLKVTMGLDPGLRTGVKVVVVDSTGQLLAHTTIFPHAPKKQWDSSIATLAKLGIEHKVDLIAIGNGTASRETDKLAGELLKKHPEITAQKIIVSEAGASVYSASETAAKEFPKLDVSFRGAVSIARRLQDPLAELVKIEPKAIGVGQYQHDVNQSKLSRSLDAVVEDCVNAVGVDVNTASAPLMARIAGLNSTIAGNIVSFRDKNGVFANRESLKQVPRLGAKTFEQAAGFLRIVQSDNPLDSSSVHPESYCVVEKIAAQHEKPIDSILGDGAFLKSVSAKEFTNEQFGLLTVSDIISELEKPGRDPRPEFKMAQLKDGVETVKDLKPDMILEGTITNVTNFGAFVDVGVHQDGLVHISALSDTFVKDAHSVVKAGDIVKVKVIDVDVERDRIGLSMRLNDKPKQAGDSDRQPGTARSTGKNQHRKKSHNGNTASSRNSSAGAKTALADGKTGTFADLFASAKPMKTKKS